MSDVQLLAHLLDMAGEETSASRELSHAMLDSFQGLEQVLGASQAELLEYPGLSEGGAIFLLLLSALIQRYAVWRGEPFPPPAPVEPAPEFLAGLPSLFRNDTDELVRAFLLDADGQMLSSVTVAHGSETAVSFSVRRVVELVLAHRSSGIVLAHNHPNGARAFSKSDLVATVVLMRALSVVEIPLIEHYLIAEGKVYALRQHELLAAGEELEWYPPGEENKRISKR